MHIQIVTFHLKDITEAEYRTACEQEAHAFADVPGLISKVWLANAVTNTYGGVYTWENREAMERYTQSDLFASITNDPHLGEVASTDFGILEGPTRVTHSLSRDATAVA